MKNFLASFVLVACLVFSVAAVRRTIYVDNANTYITSGTCVTSTDGTVTNTFATAFSSAPKVFLSQVGTLVTGTNILTSVTASNFVVNTKSATTTNNWIAIGTP
jgi:hypothetical protein